MIKSKSIKKNSVKITHTYTHNSGPRNKTSNQQVKWIDWIYRLIVLESKKSARSIKHSIQNFHSFCMGRVLGCAQLNRSYICNAESEPKGSKKQRNQGKCQMYRPPDLSKFSNPENYKFTTSYVFQWFLYIYHFFLKPTLHFPNNLSFGHNV